MFMNILTKVAHSIALPAIIMASLSMVDDLGPSPARKASAFAGPRERLTSFEIYHIPDGNMYRSRISLNALISSFPAQDYARISAENSFAVDSLYQALDATILSPSIPCETNDIDARWAIVLNYKDHTKEAIGFNRVARCVQFLSRKEPTTATSGLVTFVDRTFGFMR